MIPSLLAVASKQLDMKMFVESYSERPPVAAASEHNLLAWAELRKFEVTRISHIAISIKEIISCKGVFSGYDQVWVHKDNTNYRDVLVRFLARQFRCADDCTPDFEAFDADHVVAKVRLKLFDDAWINIFPVRKSWNMFFGGLETQEQFMIRHDQLNHGLYLATGFEFLKLFCSDISRITETSNKWFVENNDLIEEIAKEMKQLGHL